MPQKVILYGSYYDGTQREGSGIDVVIVSDDFAGKGHWERQSRMIVKTAGSCMSRRGN